MLFTSQFVHTKILGRFLRYLAVAKIIWRAATCKSKATLFCYEVTDVRSRKGKRKTARQESGIER